MERKRRRLFRTALVIALLLALVGLTISTYAYWDNLQQTTNETITIGVGETVTVSPRVVVPEGKILVPVGALLGYNDVDSIDIKYTVSLSKPLSEAIKLTVEATGIAIAGNTYYSKYVNVTINNPKASGGFNSESSAEVIVTVTLNDDELTTTDYEGIKSQAITFNLTFTAGK
jgi:hypothetical protein